MSVEEEEEGENKVLTKSGCQRERARQRETESKQSIVGCMSVEEKRVRREQETKKVQCIRKNRIRGRRPTVDDPFVEVCLVARLDKVVALADADQVPVLQSLDRGHEPVDLVLLGRHCEGRQGNRGECEAVCV